MSARYSPAHSVSSPCEGTCRLVAGILCAGCGRLLEEITNWEKFDNTTKQAIVDLARMRRDAFRAQQDVRGAGEPEA